MTTNATRKPRAPRRPRESRGERVIHWLAARLRPIIGLITGLVIVVGGVSQIAWSRDVNAVRDEIANDRKAFAAAIAAQQKATEGAIFRGALSTESALLDMRKRTLEDQVFKLQSERARQGKRFTMADQAALDRAMNELNETRGELGLKKKLLQEMQIPK